MTTPSKVDTVSVAIGTLGVVESSGAEIRGLAEKIPGDTSVILFSEIIRDVMYAELRGGESMDGASGIMLTRCDLRAMIQHAITHLVHVDPSDHGSRYLIWPAISIVTLIEQTGEDKIEHGRGEELAKCYIECASKMLKCLAESNSSEISKAAKVLLDSFNGMIADILVGGEADKC